MADAEFGWLAPAARQHILAFLRELAPLAPDLSARLDAGWRRRGRRPDQIQGLLAVTPAAAVRRRRLDAFLRSVERSGRVLAAAGLGPADAAAALDDFESLLARRLPGRFQPAREQLRSAVIFTLYRVFYELRERDVRRLEAIARRAEEQERRRIGRELHDEAGQSLVVLRLQLEMLERDAPAALRPRLREARGGVETIIGELRRIVAALSPAVLERLGLAAAIRHLCLRFRQSYPAALRLRLGSLPPDLPMEIQEVVYRVAQESLQNIAKHSCATCINLSLLPTDMSIRLRLSDNGAGFNTETAGRQPMSFGLFGMRQRAELLGGALAIRSAPGQGTLVRLDLPAPGRMASNGKDSHTDRGRSHPFPAGHPDADFRRARHGGGGRRL
jgi:two-component system sensor histidine kinase UhpB